MVKCYICRRKHFFSFITYIWCRLRWEMWAVFYYICKLFDKYGGGCGYQVDGCTLFYIFAVISTIFGRQSKGLNLRGGGFFMQKTKKITFFACQLKKVLYLQSEKHKNC